MNKLMKEVDIDITLIREQGYREERQTFQKNPVPKLIKMCNEKAKEVRNSATNKATSHKMKHYGKQVITKGVQIGSLTFK